MRVLVTGLSGFVGQALLPLLQQHDVIAFGRQNSISGFEGEYHSIDLNDHVSVRNMISRLKLDACVHLAWQDIPKFDVHTCLNNFSNSVNLAASLDEANCSKVIVTGTCLEYKGNSGACRENQLGNNLDLFGQFKHSLNLIWEKLQSARGYHWIRPFYIYGENQRKQSLLPFILRTYKTNNVPRLDNPQGSNDYVHVSDVARLIMYLLENQIKSGPINAGSGFLYKNSDICDLVELLAKNDSSFDQFSFPELTVQPEQGGFYADMNYARSIGFENKVTFKDGIRQMYENSVK